MGTLTENPIITRDEQEIVSLVYTELVSDFPSENKTDCKIVVLPYPTRISSECSCVYWRYEPAFHPL
jgi:hypothetical protein